MIIRAVFYLETLLTTPLHRRLEKAGRFGNVVSEKEDRLDRWCKNEEVKEDRNTLRTIKRRNVHWIGHILRRNCRLKHVIYGKIEETGRPGIRCKHPLDGLKQNRRY
jgi:hypothetical protein